MTNNCISLFDRISWLSAAVSAYLCRCRAERFMCSFSTHLDGLNWMCSFVNSLEIALFILRGSHRICSGTLAELSVNDELLSETQHSLVWIMFGVTEAKRRTHFRGFICKVIWLRICPPVPVPLRFVIVFELQTIILIERPSQIRSHLATCVVL